MSRLIDADALLEQFDIWDDADELFVDSIREEIKHAPTIEPERKNGRWIRHPEQKNIYGGKCVECSECGEKYIVQFIEDKKFCRNCGEDMRGDADE